jgi:predicted ribonuclease YlaK
MAKIFYDTCSLLNLQADAFKDSFYLSSITLNELENIKTSGTKDEETKWKARQVLHLLKENEGVFSVIRFKESDAIYLSKYDLPHTNDSKIILTALNILSDDEDVFITDDLACYYVAKSVGLNAQILQDIILDDYQGFKKVVLSEQKMLDFYGDAFSGNKNIYNLLENEYLIIEDKETGKIIDKYKWVNHSYENIPYIKVQSKMLGKVAPLNGDIYQMCALDSLKNNQITMLKGPAGSGKSLLAFGHMFSLLESGEISKIIIFCNTVATKGSAKLGFYPGSRTEKLLDSQIGNFLVSKLGDRVAVERLIDDGELILLPMSDIRGFDTSGMNAAIYITEAQNLDIELMRLALQRIGEDSICILDGDYNHQVDMSIYSGSNNGMRRVSQVFRGKNFYGEVELQNIHRSKIAKVAEEM